MVQSAPAAAGEVVAAPSTQVVGRWRILGAASGGGAIILQSESCREVQPANWGERLLEALAGFRGAGVVAVGAKRLSPEGKVFSMGEFVVHPKGFHHLGKGLAGEAYRFPEEVDAVVGGVLAVDGPAFERAGGAALLRGELGALELGLSLRKAGGRYVSVPQVVATDTLTPAPNVEEEQSFRGRWGFDWKAADLDLVHHRYAGTGLLWNVRFHARAMPFEKYRQRPAVHWSNYEKVEPYRKRADHLAGLVKRLAGAVSGRAAQVLDIGCGDGLFSHLFALAGAKVTGLDPEEAAIEQARRCVQKLQYPGGAPTFITGRGDALPVDDVTLDVVVILDVIEHLPNPVSVLREVTRVLRPGGQLLISTPAWQFGGSSDPVYHASEYTPEELVFQVQAATPLRVAHTGMISGLYRDLIVIASKPAG